MMEYVKHDEEWGGENMLGVRTFLWLLSPCYKIIISRHYDENRMRVDPLIGLTPLPPTVIRISIRIQSFETHLVYSPINRVCKTWTSHTSFNDEKFIILPHQSSLFFLIMPISPSDCQIGLFIWKPQVLLFVSHINSWHDDGDVNCNIGHDRQAHFLKPEDIFPSDRNKSYFVSFFWLQMQIQAIRISSRSWCRC